ncbi:MAG: type I restriction endonuclease subunit S [Alcanivorax sp.]|nr:type I restriction endonuclease subunit S [Alcanivorax sp.]
MAQVESTKARLERIPKILKRFRQSVLAAAVSGKLTEEWRGTNAISFQQPPITIGREYEEVPEGWAWNDLVDLAKLESGHTPRKSRTDYWENGDVPWISLQDIRAAHGRVIEKTKFMPNMKGIENSSARILPRGTVCFSRDISVGYTTIMGCEMATTQHFVNWICSPELNNYYLMYAFMAAKDHLTISGQGSTVKTIYMPACKKFRLIAPPLDEQTEIVRRVDQLFAYADTIETQVNNALERVNNLTQSILAKALRGELTEQWRKDNPDLITGKNSAEALLEKIKAERVAAKPVKRGRKKAK